MKPGSRAAPASGSWRGRRAGPRRADQRAPTPQAPGGAPPNHRPYPTRFGLGGVARSPLPIVVMTNRVNVVQFDTDDGPKTLLFNPTDYERSAETPYFARIRRKMGALGDLLMVKRPKTPDHLEKI